MQTNMQPAYVVDAWLPENGNSPLTGPQCSAHGDFCFLCQFRESASDQDDAVGEMKSTIRLLGTQSKELPLIVSTIQEKYNSDIKSSVTYTHPTTGVLISTPDWTKKSIQTHLLYSTEFPALFDTVVIHVYQSIIMRLQSQMIDAVTNEVNEDTRKALVDTVKALSSFREKNAPSRGSNKR